MKVKNVDDSVKAQAAAETATSDTKEKQATHQSRPTRKTDSVKTPETAPATAKVNVPQRKQQDLPKHSQSSRKAKHPSEKAAHAPVIIQPAAGSAPVEAAGHPSSRAPSAASLKAATPALPTIEQLDKKLNWHEKLGMRVFHKDEYRRYQATRKELAEAKDIQRELDVGRVKDSLQAESLKVHKHQNAYNKMMKSNIDLELGQQAVKKGQRDQKWYYPSKILKFASTAESTFARRALLDEVSDSWMEQPYNNWSKLDDYDLWM